MNAFLLRSKLPLFISTNQGINMTDQPFGIRFFHSENELRADRLNKLELCRHNILQSVLQKEKTLYEKTFKQRYEQTLRSRASRRLGEIHSTKYRRIFPQGGRLPRRFSADTTRGSSHLHHPIVRKRPVTYNGERDVRFDSDDGSCVLCENVAKGIRGFKFDENIQQVKVLHPSSSHSREQEPIISCSRIQENCEQLNYRLDDCSELCRLFSVNSPERKPSVCSQTGIYVNDSSNDTNGGAKDRDGDTNFEKKHQVENTLNKELPEIREPAAEVLVKSSHTNNNNSDWSSKRGRSRNHKKGYNPQQFYHSHATFNTEPNTDKNFPPGTNVNNNVLPTEVEQNLSDGFTGVNIENNNSLISAEPFVRQKMCHCRDQNGLRVKVDRFLEIQGEYNKRNPLSKEISAQSEIIRLKSNTCERRKKVEPEIMGPKDAIINEVLTSLRLIEEQPTSPENLPPIIM